MVYKINKVTLLFIATILGYFSWILPPIIIRGTEQVEGHFGISVLTDISQARNYSILCLFISGVILGFLDPRRGPFWAMATMLLVIILATIDGLFGFSPHSLFGIEIIMYAIFTIPAFLGALLIKFSIHYLWNQ